MADLDRNIVSIRYNVLNLPDTIQFSNGNQISNRYTADGIKRMSTYITSVFDVAIPLGSVCQWYRYSRQVYQSNGTIYCGNAEYEIITTGGASLQRIDFGNGYIRNNTYYYTITDYLGNISSVWNGTSNVVEQQTTYYPSGLPHRTSTNANLQRYKYNGKELITNHGYDQYDYHARGYYPAIMRFTSVDPLAEKYYGISPYVYCANNPIIYIDPDGRAISTVIGTIVGGVGGGISAAIKGTDIRAGVAEGAVAGFIAGAAVDITVATCGFGGIALVGAATAAGTLGGAAGGVVGDITNQAISQRNSETITITTENFGSKALFGAVSGALGGVGSGTVKVLGNVAESSTQALQTTMIQGVAANTTEAAASAVTKGAVRAATNTGVGIMKLDATVSTFTSTATTVVGALSSNQSSKNSQSTKSSNSQNTNSNNSQKPAWQLFLK